MTQLGRFTHVAVVALLLSAITATAHADAPLAEAIHQQNDSRIDALLREKADVNAPEADGRTPLHWAVHFDQPELVKRLLAAGADVNDVIVSRKASGKSPVSGTSPLILAVENGHFELALVLVRAGADPNDQRSGFTPLHTLTWVRKPNRGDGDDGGTRRDLLCPIEDPARGRIWDVAEAAMTENAQIKRMNLVALPSGTPL